MSDQWRQQRALGGKCKATADANYARMHLRRVFSVPTTKKTTWSSKLTKFLSDAASGQRQPNQPINQRSSCCSINMVVSRVVLFVCIRLCVYLCMCVRVCVRMRVCLCALCVAVLSPHATHALHATRYMSYAISTDTHTNKSNNSKRSITTVIA